MKDVRVELPANLCRLAKINGPVVQLAVAEPVTQRSVLDALEAKLPTLLGTVRDHGTQQRRAYVRFFACCEDISHNSMDEPLPMPVADGLEPLLIIGAVSGG
jgi:hypothetical protein